MLRMNFFMSICDNIRCKNISSYVFKSDYDQCVSLNCHLCKECAVIMQNFQTAEHEIF